MPDDKRRVILLILDGWGHRDTAEHNAVKIAHPVNYNNLLSTDPHILLDASGEHVGLPSGQMGNSEVGHTNLGAGRIVYQDLVRISRSFESGEAGKNPAFLNFIKNIKSGRLHLLGLLSDGGVHSHIEHFKGAIAAAHREGVKEIYIHVITDGRDTPPTSGINYMNELADFLKEEGAGVIADVCGRFYLMDRDKRWDRVERAYKMLRFGEGIPAADAAEAVKASYAAGVTDEFIEPVIIKGIDGKIKDGDGLFFMNFRADRVREMMSAFYMDSFDSFDRGAKPDVSILTLTDYDSSMPAPVMYAGEELKAILGDIISKAGLKQLRIAETEKYPHVTYFFNGGSEIPFEGEDRILIPSPREVATYDLKPQMSVQEVEAAFEKRYAEGDLNLVVMNFANPDMVGHTGVEEAAVSAVKYVDEMLGKVIAVADKAGAVLMVTADHGNCEMMWDDEHNQPYTAHTTNPVWLILHNYSAEFKEQRGKLADVAPTILKIMGLPVPPEMTGTVLV
jgi:2,3-bisphosphoglycerate-independent phosphoglycerate mutase